MPEFMRPQFKNPPLVEAIAEFRFEPGQEWDWAIPGMVFSRIKDQYPKRRQLEEVAVSFDGKQTHPPAITPAQRVQFLRDDESALVQIGPNHLIINQLRPYPGWPEFLLEISSILEDYVAESAPAGITRMGLRYINKIEIPIHKNETDGGLADFVIALPQMAQVAEIRRIRGLLQRIEFEVTNRPGVVILQSGSTVPSQPDSVAVLLDLDHVTDFNPTCNLGDIATHLDISHQIIEESFWANTTDLARELFDES